MPQGAGGLRLSVIQMNPGSDTQANIDQARRLIDGALGDRPDLVALPEMWSCLGGDRATKLAAAEALPPPGSADPGGPTYEFLRETARSAGIHVHGGSIGERPRGAPDDRFFNTTVVFDPNGHEIARYRKIHLFDIDTADGQGFRESATYRAGDQIVLCQVGPLRLGLAICYDLRFPELFAALRAGGADLILLPAAFTAFTGKDHWEPLLRARAIETQCWIGAPATTGGFTESGAARTTHGHSLICDPWGHVVARASDGIGWASARVDLALSARVRRDMPVQAHRRVAQLLAQSA